MEPLFFLFVAGMVVVLVFAVSKRRAEALNRSWNRVAEQLGVPLKPGAWHASPELKGNVSGYPLIVDIDKRRSGKHSTSYTRFTLGVPHLPAGAKLKREGFISGISRAFGVKDIELGDAAFDSQVHVRADDAEAMRAFLTPVRRRSIGRFLESHAGAVIDEGGISWSIRGRMTDARRIHEIVEEMLALARSLSDEGVADNARETAAPGRQAEPALNDPAADREALPAATGVPAVAMAAEPTTSQTHRSEPDGAADFCAAVFAAGAMSFEAAKTFEAGYKGKRVTWAGVLSSAEPYRYDFVFGAGPAVKATIVLPAHEAGAGKSRGVKAVVSVAAADDLASRIGERIGFVGTLLRLDGFNRTVFLSDGALV